MSDNVLVDPSRQQLSDELCSAAEDAFYRVERKTLWPWPRLKVWAARNTDAGHWRLAAPRRRLGLAWWVDASGRRHVRVIGHMLRRGRTAPHPFADVTGKRPPPWRYVYPTPSAAVKQVGAARVLGTLPPEFAGSIRDAGDDLMPLLVACDWLDEHGHDPTPIRGLFQEVKGAVITDGHQGQPDAPLRFGAEAMRYFKAEELAKILNLSLSSVYERFADGSLPVHKFGRKKGYRVSQADLDAFLSKRRQEGVEVEGDSFDRHAIQRHAERRP